MTVSTVVADFDEAPCGLLTTDGQDLITRVNATFAAWTGFVAAELVGREFASLLVPGAQAFYATRYQDELWTRGEVLGISLRLRRADGSELPILLNTRMIRSPAGALSASLAVFDATSREELERDMLVARRAAESSAQSIRELQLAGTRFLAASSERELAEELQRSAREMFAASEVVVAAYEPDGSAFRVIAGEERRPLLDAVRAMRAPGARALGVDEAVLIPDLDDAFARSEEVGRLLHGARSAAFSGVAIASEDEVFGALVCLFGRPRTFDARTVDLMRTLSGQAGLAFARIAVQDRLRELASRDPLTGLPNRAAIDETAERWFDGARADGGSLAVMFVDLDGFKPINDSLGHRAGDVVLQEVARRIERSVRGVDFVGRFGGDEFVVLCEGGHAEEGLRIGERVAAAVAAPLPSLPQGLAVSASIGVAVADARSVGLESSAALIRRADTAMYAAKRAGGGRVALAD